MLKREKDGDDVAIAMCRGLSESVLSANFTDPTLHDSFQSSRGEPLWPSGFVQFILCAVLSASLRESSVYSRTTHKINWTKPLGHRGSPLEDWKASWRSW